MRCELGARTSDGTAQTDGFDSNNAFDKCRVGLGGAAGRHVGQSGRYATDDAHEAALACIKNSIEDASRSKT